jgi:hypothetical protein
MNLRSQSGQRLADQKTSSSLSNSKATTHNDATEQSKDYIRSAASGRVYRRDHIFTKSMADEIDPTLTFLCK